MSENLFKLIWTSQNGAVTLDRGEYASIPEASADFPAAEVRLQAEFPATVDFHYPHDIKAGTWRVVPIEPVRPDQELVPSHDDSPAQQRP